MDVCFTPQTTLLSQHLLLQVYDLLSMLLVDLYKTLTSPNDTGISWSFNLVKSDSLKYGSELIFAP